jgi:hypothetical protein
MKFFVQAKDKEQAEKLALEYFAEQKALYKTH